MLKKRQALGKGLGALLSDADVSPREFTAALGSINVIPLEQIEVNPYQPRKDFAEEALRELADSIRVQGIIQPITVRRLNDSQYQIISGERRVQASKLAGLSDIPAYIRVANDQQMLEMALIENIQREDLNPLEIALSYQRLIAECSLKQEELGDRVGKKRSTVTNYLRLLKLPDSIQASLRDGKLNMGHARALISIENTATQLSLFKKIMAEDLSVRKVEELARHASMGKQTEVKKEGKPEMSFEIRQLQGKLASHFGAQVKIQHLEDNKGEIKIPYQSVEDLNRILELINL